MVKRNLRQVTFGLALAGMLGAVPVSAGSTQKVWSPTLVLGAVLPTASGVKAGAEGAEWALPGGTRVVASADAELRVIAKAQHLAFAGRKDVPVYTVLLKSGSVRAIVPPAATSAIIVAAPKKASVIVASGEASVIADTQVAVANHQGSTSVGVDGQAFRSLPGGTVEVLGGGRHALLAAPASAGVRSVVFAQDGRAELGAFSFAAVDGARAYRVELRDTKTGRLVTRAETQATNVPAGFAELDPGGYTLRLAAVDEAGFESARPLERSVQVVGLGLPAGGYMDPQGAVVVPPGSRVVLAGSPGLEIGFGQGTFVPAPPSLELLRSEPRFVVFRAAGAADSAELWLVPRKARAQIEFGQRAPRWPGEPLPISVRIDGQNGPAEWANVKPTVSVGVEPVAVEFKRDGEWLRGSLPARPGVGPWVVRVEVKDRTGLELGRNFIEVAGAAR